MISYKEKEREHYNSKQGHIESLRRNSADIINENAIKYFYKIVAGAQEDLNQGRILDYGCGAGGKSVKILNNNWILDGIDISEISISHANEKYGSLPNVSFNVMDCEHTTFPDNTFDIVFDFGTFSSINIDKATTEIIRILKPTGTLICIETLGHNPIINLKRKISAYQGKRTQWASSHIMKIKNWEDMQRRFISNEIRHFNILSIFYAPLMRYFPTKISFFIRKVFWSIDDHLINNSKFSNYAFKTVACFRGVNK